MPAVMLTLMARTERLLVGNNPGTGTLQVDPYAGWIANTSLTPPARVPITPGNILLKLREHGPLKFMTRSRSGCALPGRAPADGPRLTDERTLSQLRAIHWLLGHLDAAAERRAVIQRRRRRSDREIFERFPLYVVPTYPGDEPLFASPGFEAWLPKDLPLVRCKLDEVMEMGTLSR